MFSSFSKFEKCFNMEDATAENTNELLIEGEKKNQVVSKLHAILRPFVLRRSKEDVDISIPKKREVVLFPTLTATQL